ncbi:MAG: bifunctional DNA-formamidopyrimidine glycosylase/DNA-(apurinic or apyrimidinic site) lyase [Gammaproteobacteria bacterium]|jgi:formamidopyrimidine-DNA glycosylase|nr:bifunctional DNA-formamidopyrimidine glycosylase/DNA-(apurinic or apyrimidinic site) lyase [Gammaproteobacteria bacterium]
MPELPEVETTRRGIAPWLEGQRVARLITRVPALRWPIPAGLPGRLAGAEVLAVARRAKYLLLRTDRGTALVHLGMSGSLRVLHQPRPPGKHDHFDLVTAAGVVIRFNDPRRFGALLWTEADPATHPLLASLGPEPLDSGFDTAWLWAHCRGRKVAIKPHIMNAHIVVGVGNIYASEALFRAGIRPARAAGRLGEQRLAGLVNSIREVLSDAIRAGGTTLRDYSQGDGQPGYFMQDLRVYERAGKPCVVCATPVKQQVLGQRSSYYCPRCQR